MDKWIKYETLKRQIVAKSSQDYEQQIRKIIALLKI
jgi:hypothetical protein